MRKEADHDARDIGRLLLQSTGTGRNKEQYDETTPDDSALRGEG